jgi:hypothetical protein
MVRMTVLKSMAPLECAAPKTFFLKNPARHRVEFFRTGPDRACRAVMRAWSSTCSMPSGTVCASPSFRRHARTTAAALVGVGDQHLDHLIDRHVIVVGMPAIVIGHHGDEA